MKKKTVGTLVATAAFGLMLAGNVMATDDHAAGTETTVKCKGVNECKGHGACHSATNSCAGKNECKGKGWVKTATEKECTDKHGTVEK
ncbi:hypothetical protein K1X76_04300 [bacterium]|nr:hypothetical protein [bacterium]